MARQQKLVKKLQKQLRKVKDRTRGDYDSMDLREEVMADSPRVYATIRGQQRQLDASFGQDTIAQEAMIAVELSADDFDRHDFDGLGDNGVRMVLASGLVEALGIQAGDQVYVKEGEYEGRTLEVVSVDASLDELRFADDAGKSAETDITATARLSSLS